MNLSAKKGFGSCSKKGAFGSIFRSSKLNEAAKQSARKLWKHKYKRSFFCSNFVVTCYTVAGGRSDGDGYYEPLFPIKASAKISPKGLEAYLKRQCDWEEGGTLVPRDEYVRWLARRGRVAARKAGHPASRAALTLPIDSKYNEP